MSIAQYDHNTHQITKEFESDKISDGGEKPSILLIPSIAIIEKTIYAIGIKTPKNY